MALMIPQKPADNNSEGEIEVFKALQTHLDDNYIVFHSVPWINSSKKAQGEADFLILHRNLGILILEVKSGYIRCENGQWFQRNRKTNEEREIQDPLQQANNSKFKIRELLKDNNIRSGLVCHAVWFPSFDWTFPYPIHYASEIVFGKKTLLSPQVTLENTFSYWSNVFKTKSNYDTYTFNQIKLLIAPTFSAVPSMRANFEHREQLFIQLTQNQARIMDFLEEQRTAVISGSAGTGKTLLALEKAKRLAAKKEKTLFLCYNEALKNYLATNHSITDIYFKTIYELATEFKIPTTNLELNSITELLYDYLDDKRTKRNWIYQHVIVDEAQDFDALFMDKLKDMTTKTGCFYAFYDKNQNIHQIPSGLEWVNHAECKLTLNTNCRNTKEIARTAARNIKLGSMTFAKAEITGQETVCMKCETEKEMLIWIEKIVSNLLNEKGAKPEDIVVLTMKPFDQSILNKQNRIAQKKVSRFLTAGAICINSVDEFKGLEAGFLILIDVEIDKYNDEAYRSRMYIGCSRAKQELYILFHQPKQEDFKNAMIALKGEANKRKKDENAFYEQLNITLKNKIDDSF